MDTKIADGASTPVAAPAGNGHQPPTQGQWQPLTARNEVWWWTGAVTLVALAALVVSVVAIALHHSTTTTAAPAAGAAAAAAAPTGQTIDFNAEPGAGFKARTPEAPAPLPGQVHNITIHMVEKKLEIAPGVKQTMWTFDGEVPGPVYRGAVGDTFNFTIVNSGTTTHSMDFHAGMVSPSTAMVPIEPGQSHTYTFVAKRAGIFMYHCGTAPGAHAHRGRDVRRRHHRSAEPAEGRPRVRDAAVRAVHGQGRRDPGDGQARERAVRRRGVQRLRGSVQVRADQGAGRTSASGSGCSTTARRRARRSM